MLMEEHMLLPIACYFTAWDFISAKNDVALSSKVMLNIVYEPRVANRVFTTWCSDFTPHYCSSIPPISSSFRIVIFLMNLFINFNITQINPKLMGGELFMIRY